MVSKLQIEIPSSILKDFCRRNHVSRLSFFGSIVRDDFGPESDIDVLVEFEPEHVPGLIRLAGMELELSGFFAGRKVDLNTPAFFRPSLRRRILEEARVEYAES